MPYISETVHPKIRGSLATMPAFMIATGLLLAWIFGYFLTWRMTAYLLMIPPMLLAILIIPLPESPYWLVEHNNTKAAKKSLQFFRGKHYDITEEFNEIQWKHELKKNQNKQKSWKFVIQRMFSMAFFKPFSCVGILHMMNTLLGFNPLLTYTIEILDEAGSNIDPHMGLIIIGSIRIVFAGKISF